ncbi:hypothetical protein B0H16DRAFT_726308 [Mycena metata]|uniref:Uncharacterized protein n=1 Tax=Mycena metata TaxID=1033252 RepID=A0AAD7K785_9AGAR|nr:hypothetical protein B0H16DRAFT_726308 [Mycena metata]
MYALCLSRLSCRLPGGQNFGSNPSYTGRSRCAKVLDMIRSESFPGSAVRYLLIQGDDNSRAVLLSACPLVENLWINPDVGPDVFPQIEVLPLKRLYCNLSFIFGPDRPLDFTRPMFAALTHLELLDNLWYDIEADAFQNLSLIPNLTHLAFCNTEFKDVWLPLLRECAALRVLVVLECNLGHVVTGDPDDEALVQDPRFVELHRGTNQYTTDWIIGAHSGVDYWLRAEGFVAKRRSGEIDARQYWLNRPPRRVLSELEC